MNDGRQQWGQVVRRGAGSAGELIAAGAARLPDGLGRGVDRMRSIAAPVTENFARATLVFCVVAPTVLFLLYAALIETRVYVTTAKIAVRGSAGQTSVENSSSSQSMKSTGEVQLTQALQDAYIILNYVQSSAIINNLGGQAFMEKYFSSGDIDYLSRLKRNAPIEDDLQYWLRRVKASVDNLSGVLTIETEGFSPAAPVEIARRIIGQSETLINEITLRNRQDALSRAEHEVSLAADKLASDREQVRLFRQKNALIDPNSSAQNINDMISKLASDRADIENVLATLKGVVRADSPTRRIQQTKLEAIDRQIAELKKSLTESGNPKAVSTQIGEYERLKLQETFSQSVYTLASTNYVTARQDLEKQQVYVVTVVTPLVPTEALYPKVIGETFMVFFSLFVVWAIVVLLAASVKDHML